MIEGIKIEVPSEELKNILKLRISHHRTKAAFYEEQANKLREVMKATSDGEGGTGTLANNANTLTNSGGLESSHKLHKEKAKFFTFMHDHIIPNESYRLDHGDLVQLEVTSY